MNPATTEQKNPYRGVCPRAWLRVRFLDRSGAARELILVVDTGCPHAFVIDPAVMSQLSRMQAPSIGSNFGGLSGGWVRLAMSDFGLDPDVLGFASAAVHQAVASDDPSFQGLVGLPILRMAEYGGNTHEFWFRAPIPSQHTTP